MYICRCIFVHVYKHQIGICLTARPLNMRSRMFNKFGDKRFCSTDQAVVTSLWEYAGNKCKCEEGETM